MRFKLRENYELIFEKLQENGKKNRNDFILIIVIIKPGIHLSASRRTRRAEPAQRVSVDSNPSWGRLSLLLNPIHGDVGPSKWTFTELWLVCAQCGRIISVFGELHRGIPCLLSVLTENFSLAWGLSFHLHGGQKMLIFLTPCKVLMGFGGWRPNPWTPMTSRGVTDGMVRTP